MTTIQLSLLILFIVFLFIFLVMTLGTFLYYRFLLARIDRVVKVIQKVNEKRTNFVLQKAHNVSKNNNALSSLVAAWAIEAKEMRTNSAMASLHTRHLINLVGSGKFLEATRYSKTLLTSVDIFNKQWDELVGDMNKLIDFAHHPVSLVTDQKRQYAEIDTIRRTIIGKRVTKTSEHLRKIAESIENDFIEFENVWVKGDFTKSLNYVKKIRRKLKAYLDILQEMPIVVYLMGVVFKKEKALFREIHDEAEKRGLIMEKIRPIQRCREYSNKIASLNESFIEEKVSAHEVKGLLVDEIMKLKKMNILLMIEIKCKEKYLKTYSDVMDALQKIRHTWKDIRKKELFKYHSEGTIAELDKMYRDLKILDSQHSELKKQTPMSLYSEQLTQLSRVSGQIVRLKSQINLYLEEALEFEKEREVKIGTAKLLSNEIDNFYHIQTATKWKHIRKYIERQVSLFKKSFDDFQVFLKDASYNQFREVRLAEEELNDSLSKLKWEVETLESNEINIRHLYEVANRFRSDSKFVNNNLDKAEIHISYHEIKEAYTLIKRILKDYDSKALKKYPVVFK